MKAKWFLYLFVVVSSLDVAFVHYGLPRYTSKSLIIPSLALYYFFQSGASLDKLFLVALVFAFLGDFFLLFDGDTFFMLGLSSFLVMQLLYGYLFCRQGIDKSAAKLIIAAALVLLALISGYQLIPHLGELKIPVLVYTLSIVMMAIFAVLRLPTKSYLLMVFGVICFVVSDSILGFNRFSGAIPYAGVLVMSTYILAQYCIVAAYLDSESRKLPAAKK